MASSKLRGGYAVESLGARFKRERERKKMTLDEVAAATKIGTRMLTALENDQFDLLPGGIFNKGFVRSYARQLGMDEEQAVADYLAATSPTQPLKEPEEVLSALAVRAEKTRAIERPGDGGLPWDKLAAVLLLVAFGFALWGWRARKQTHAATSQPSNPPVADSAPVPAPAIVTAPPPPAVTADVPATSAAPPAVSGGSEPSAAPQPQPAAPASSGSFVVLIHARDDSWVDVTADGKDVLHALLPAGEQKSVAAEHEIVVKAGNIGGLDFTFNGKKLTLQGQTDEVKTLRFDSSGLQTHASAAQNPANPA